MNALREHRATVTPLMASLVLLLLTIAAYWPALGAGYIWDDDDYLTRNSLVQQWDGLAKIWQPLQTRQYYPLVFTTFWIEHKLWGLQPFGFHLVNVLLHAASALLVWRIARWLKLSGAWMIAAVFALHPVHVESVAWVTERKNTLSGVLYLAAMLSYLKFDARRSDGDADWWRYVLALVSFAGAMFSKTVTASLPVAIVIVLLLQRERLTVRRLLPLVPMLAIGVALGLNTAYVERVNVGAVGPEFELSLAERCLIASRALLFYPAKLLVPWPLCFFYERWTIDAASAAQWVPVIVVIAAIGALAWLWMRCVRWPACAAMFFGVTIFPALGFVSVYPMRYSFVADHFQYLASLGVIAGVVGAAAWWLREKQWKWGLAAILLAVLAALTFRQARNYHDEETLWRATLACNPTSWAALNNLAGVLLREANDAQTQGDHAALHERITEAESLLRQAIALKPDHSRARSQLSEALRIQGRLEESLAEMQRSHTDLITSTLRMTDRQRERASYEIAESHYQLARLHNLLGQHDVAETHYRDAIAAFSNFPSALNELGAMLAADGRMDDAAMVYRQLLALAPDAVYVHQTLGDYERNHGNWSAALDHYQAVSRHADHPSEALWAYDRMARLLATCPDDSVRNGRAAVELAQRVVNATNGQAVYPLATLAAAHAEQGDFAAAIDAAERAIALAEQLGLTDAVNEITPQLESYKARKPWRMQSAGEREITAPDAPASPAAK